MTNSYINLKIYQGKTFNHIANDVGSLYFVQITRVIVEWLAAGQISKFRISMFDTLKPFRLQLFCCREAAVHCVTIPGLVKHSSFTSGDNLDKDSPNHAWNAVYIPGYGWKLLDVTWAAGYMSRDIDGNLCFIKSYSEHYIFTDPSEFILDHFPLDCSWQLLRHTVTKRDFCHSPIVHPSYFIFGIWCDKSRRHDITCESGEFTLSLTCKQSLLYTYHLISEGNDDASYNCYVSYCASATEATFRVHLPFSGRFVLTIYAAKGYCPMRSIITFSIWTRWYSSNKLLISNPPLCGDKHILWGPTITFQQLGLAFLETFSTMIKVGAENQVQLPSIAGSHGIRPAGAIFSLTSDNTEKICRCKLKAQTHGKSVKVLRSFTRLQPAASDETFSFWLPGTKRRFKMYL